MTPTRVRCIAVSHTANLKSGPRRQFGPRRSPERFGGFHRVIGPIRPCGNTHSHLGRSFGKTGYVVNGKFCCINRYTSDTRFVTALQSYTAIQRYTALYSAIHYTAIHRYTLYNLYSTPLGLSLDGGTGYLNFFTALL